MRRLQPLLIHGFSVGGYLYGETLVKMLGNPDQYKGLTDRITAQIFDSPVDIQGIPSGISQATTNNPVAQKAIKFSIASYLAMTKSTTGKHYDKSSLTFTTNELRTPSLLLYSKTDPIGEAKRIEEVGNAWHQKGIPTEFKCFEDSSHVAHYQAHPVEYTKSLNEFLAHTGLVRDVEVEQQDLYETNGRRILQV